MLALQANAPLGFSDNVTRPVDLASAMPPCRLLVVNDDEWMRLYLASILRSASYEVSVVDSGREALQLMRTGFSGAERIHRCQRGRIVARLDGLQAFAPDSRRPDAGLH